MRIRFAGSLIRAAVAVAVATLLAGGVLSVLGPLQEVTAGAAPVVGLYAWGDNLNGELGDASVAGSDLPVPVSLATGVSATAATGSYDDGYAIGSDGNLYAWGSYVALGNGTTTSTDTPVVVSLPAGVHPKAIAAGNGVGPDGYAIGSDGNVYAWGDNTYGQLGDGTNGTAPVTTPVMVQLPPGVSATAVASAGDAAYAIGSDGNVYAWGYNQYGDLGNGSAAAPVGGTDVPAKVLLPSGVTAKAIAADGQETFYGSAYAVGSDGNLYAWGDNRFGQLGIVGQPGTGPVDCNGLSGDSTNDTPVPVHLPSGVTPTAIAAGIFDGYTLGSNGTLYGWGDDQSAQLDQGAATNCVPAPVTMPLPSGITPTSISANDSDVFSLGSDGNLYAWGDNSDGSLGNGEATGPNTCGQSSCSTAPVRVSLPAGTLVALGGTFIDEYAVVSSTPSAPEITIQPTDQAVAAGQDATFSAAASGFPAPTVQWQVSTDAGVTFSPVPGGTSDTLTIAATTLSENGDEYEAVFTNGVSPDAVTNPVTLSVSPDAAPVISTDPLSQTVYSGQTETWTVGASGNPTPTLDWQVSVDGGVTWSDLGALTGDTITSAPLTAFENGWEIRAAFANLAGTATTTPATITVLPDIAPTITTDPLSQTVASGQTETWTVGASGNPTPTLDWQVSVDGGVTWVNLGALTGDTLTSAPLTAFENGWEIKAVFTNGGGSATTTAATITVT